jgi:hypothetical protein
MVIPARGIITMMVITSVRVIPGTGLIIYSSANLWLVIIIWITSGLYSTA